MDVVDVPADDAVAAVEPHLEAQSDLVSRTGKGRQGHLRLAPASVQRSLVRSGERRLAREWIVVALSDVLALGALRELTRRGLTAGHQVGVTGFDDSPLADVVSPGLTSLRQPMDDIAAELITILTGAPDGTPSERLLQPELVIRGSSAPG